MIVMGLSRSGFSSACDWRDGIIVHPLQIRSKEKTALDDESLDAPTTAEPPEDAA